MDAPKKFTKLDSTPHAYYNSTMSAQSLHLDSIKSTMLTMGISPTKLSELIGVSRQTVNNWLRQEDFPRPDKLLKLAVTLGLQFEQLIEVPAPPSLPEPKIAFRRKARKVTTDIEIKRAKAMGDLLRPFVQYLPYNRLVKPAEFINPTNEYKYIQEAVVDLRSELKIPNDSRIEFENLIDKFNDLKAVIVPAMWGKKTSHENALHILLPDLSATWIYLNLDSAISDFKFWMAHEMAHVFTPTLTETDAGEDFADSFAAAFLFPEACATYAYKKIHLATPAVQMNWIKSEALRFVISPITVLNEINKYAAHKKLPEITALNKSIYGAAVNIEKTFPTVSEHLFDGKPPKASEFIAQSEKAFGTQFFITLAKFLSEAGEGASYVQRVMNIPLTDAIEIYEVLVPKKQVSVNEAI
jgi:transcriptional regulator with XRE-family HTH domain